MAHIDLCRTVSETNGDFGQISKFSHPRVFNAHAEWFPWNLVTPDDGLRKLEWRGYLAEKKFDDILSHIHRVSGKNCEFLFLLKLRQISTNFNKFW